MRLCQMCWKNLKEEPATILFKEGCKNSYLLCNECLKTEVIQKLIQEDNYRLIYNTPSIKEMENIK